MARCQVGQHKSRRCVKILPCSLPRTHPMPFTCDCVDVVATLQPNSDTSIRLGHNQRDFVSHQSRVNRLRCDGELSLNILCANRRQAPLHRAIQFLIKWFAFRHSRAHSTEVYKCVFHRIWLPSLPLGNLIQSLLMPLDAPASRYSELDGSHFSSHFLAARLAVHDHKWL